MLNKIIPLSGLATAGITSPYMTLKDATGAHAISYAVKHGKELKAHPTLIGGWGVLNRIRYGELNNGE